MIYTFRDAKTEVSDVVVPGGTCADGGFVDQRINTAVRRLMTMHDAPETQGILTIVTDKDYVTLPRGVRTARAVNIGTTPTPLWHHSYTFSPSGPGGLIDTSAAFSVEAAPGSYQTAFDLPAGMNLIAFSAAPSDRHKRIRVYGKKPNGEDILDSDGQPGFDLAMRCWDDGVEGNFRSPSRDFTGLVENAQPDIERITGITLPAGLVSYVTLLAVNPATWEMYFLSKYHPEETRPGYRRMYLRNLSCCPCGDGCCRELTFMVKLDFLPMTRDDDPLLVQSLDAVKFMVMSIAEENQRNPQLAREYNAKALAALNAHTRNQVDGKNMVVTVDDPFGIGYAGDMYSSRYGV